MKYIELKNRELKIKREIENRKEKIKREITIFQTHYCVYR